MICPDSVSKTSSEILQDGTERTKCLSFRLSISIDGSPDKSEPIWWREEKFTYMPAPTKFSLLTKWKGHTSFLFQWALTDVLSCAPVIKALGSLIILCLPSSLAAGDVWLSRKCPAGLCCSWNENREYAAQLQANFGQFGLWRLKACSASLQGIRCLHPQRNIEKVFLQREYAGC